MKFTNRVESFVRKKLPPSAKKFLRSVMRFASNYQRTLQNIFGLKISHESPADPLQALLAALPQREEQLKAEYRTKKISAEPDNFVLYRIIGNDLYPRHKRGQSRENVRFLLENESEFTDCNKRWLINRIIDPDEERQIIAMLEAFDQPFIHIPFVADEYRKIGWDFDALPRAGFLSSEQFQKMELLQQDRARTALYRLKNNYVMNNNGARNAALREGRMHAKWILPLDGNCFVTRTAWEEIRQAVTRRPHLKYFAIPMERITENNLLLQDDFSPHPVEEPQILFRRDAGENFNEDFPYGRRPKVEIFWRLGIPGPWDLWRDDPWEQKRPKLSPEAHQFGVAGWVGRMNSGVHALERKGVASFKNRGRVRQQAIITAIDHVDQLVRVKL